MIEPVKTWKMGVVVRVCVDGLHRDVAYLLIFHHIPNSPNPRQRARMPAGFLRLGSRPPICICE